MPLQIRSTDGKVTPMPAHRFIEVCDVEGRIAVLVYQDDHGAIHLLQQGDPAAARYAGMFNVKFSPVTTVNLDKLAQPTS